MRVSVVLSTYNQPRWLELALWGYAAQTRRDFQLVVADDGSGMETGAVIRRMRRDAGLDLVHVWHEDRGFRKSEILNRAILAAGGEYVILSDGDCVPRADFVETHARLARPGHYLSGGYLKLPREVSERIAPEDVRSGRAFEPGWLWRHGWRPGRRALRLAGGRWASLLDACTPTRRTWNGHNASTWRDALLEVNGFDADMGYGGQDRALGERLRNLGLQGLQVRFRTPCLHLYHDRPYRDPEGMRRNVELRAEIRRERRVRARVGIAELPAEPSEAARARPGAR